MVVGNTRVEIDRVSKHFGTLKALDNVSIPIEPGEFVSFLGPSGCGKTTLLRMIGGFGVPDEGRIVIGGNVVNDVPPNRRNCGFVFQSYALFQHMTVRENVAYGLRLRKFDEKRLKSRVEEMLTLVNLTAMADRYPSQMSGGQQQRVAMARAIATEPNVLLLDEPLSALDAKLRESIRFELRALQKRLGVTTIFVTHDQEEAMVVSDRIVVMNAGRVEQIGSPADVYGAPATNFVANFVGVNNFLEGKVSGRINGNYLVETPLGGIEASGGRFETERVTLTIRPENVRIVEADVKNSVKGMVRLSAFLGSKTRLEIDCGNDMTIRVEQPGRHDYVEGRRVGIQLPADALYALPATA